MGVTGLSSTKFGSASRLRLALVIRSVLATFSANSLKWNQFRVSSYTSNTSNEFGESDWIRESVEQRVGTKTERRKRDQYFRYAAHQYRVKHYDLAVEYYLAGIKLDPHSLIGYLDLGKSYEMLGSWAPALAALERALELSPGDPTAQRRYKRIAEEQQFFQAFSLSLPPLFAASRRMYPSACFAPPAQSLSVSKKTKRKRKKRKKKKKKKKGEKKKKKKKKKK